MAQINVANEIQIQRQQLEQLLDDFAQARRNVHVSGNVYYPNPEIFVMNARVREARKNIDTLVEIGEQNKFIDV